MRVGIDARLYSETGVGRYLRNLLAQLGKIDKVNEYFVYLSKKEFDRFISPYPNFKKKLLDVGWHSISEQIIVPFIFLKDKIDVAHFPYFNVPILYPKKYLLTVHDLIIDHFNTGRASTLPYKVYLLKRLAYKIAISSAVKKAEYISVISGTTKKEIMEHYLVPGRKILVTYDALDENFKIKAKQLKPKKLYSFDYILYVGNAYPHKNLERLVTVFNKFKKNRKIKLVLAGDDPFFYKRLKKFVEQKKLDKDVVFFGNANDEDLISLYGNCRFLIFPSLMEGFGLPNFEAGHMDKLPLVSDIAVFREIWGNNLVFFDPENEEDMLKQMNFVYCLSESQYNSRVEKLKLIINRYSWKRTAEVTLDLYRKIYL